MSGTISGQVTVTYTLTVNPTTITSGTAACFAAGTRIATQGGEVPVETLRPGDFVLTASGGATPVIWLGRRNVDCAGHPNPQEVWPIRVRRDAFGAGEPHADLRLSPDHAVGVAGRLMPVRDLVNGRTIAQEACESIVYYHVELPRHALLLAEGLACESYLDTGNRGAFEAVAAPVSADVAFALEVWRTKACAPLVRDGAGLEAARRRLLERAGELGFAMTRDPAARVVAGGHTVAPEISGLTHRFRLPADAGEVRLVSRSAVPAEIFADNTDHRRIGVAVSRISLDGGAIALDDPRLSSGWHAVETDAAGLSWRWTDGDAVLALGGGGGDLDIDVVMTGRYWDEPTERARPG